MRGRKTGLAVGVLVWLACLSFVACGVALATPDGAGWQVFGYFAPTVLHPGSQASLDLYVYSTGAESNASPVKVVDRLPAGWTVGSGSTCEGEGTEVATCELGPGLPPLESQGLPASIVVPVVVPTDASSGVDHVEVSGGGSVEVVHASVPATVGSGTAGFGLANVAGWATNADGSIDTQAGSHPYEVTFAFAVNNLVKGGNQVLPAGGEARDIETRLPPGFVGNPNAIPQCKHRQFEEGEYQTGRGCPADTMVGQDTARISETGAGNGLLAVPVFNLVPPKGVAAQFGFTLANVNTYLDARVRSGGDYGITVHTDNVVQDEILADSATFWGVPGEASHDFTRATAKGTGCLEDGKGGCGSSAGLKPFLSMPTSCGAPLKFEGEVLGTWQDENARALGSYVTRDALGEPVGVTGCEKLVHFEPSVAISPDTGVADSPAGLTADVRIPQGLNPEGLATSGLKGTTVVLPEGMSVNPGQATGLTACQPSQENIGGEGEEFDGPPSCPPSSKVGTVEITTPLLPDKLEGSLYVLQSNPPDLKLLLAASGDGVNVKLVGEVHLNESTGQLTTTFENSPDFPLTEVKLAFSGGAQAALVTPPTCGVYRTSSLFTPWAFPAVESALVEGRFQIEARADGSSCSSALPFSPVMKAGSTTDQAGGFTGFSMLLQRGDDQQRVWSLQFKAPAGLGGMLGQVPLCPEPQAAGGTCSPASQIGHTVVGAGPGPYPLFIPQAGQPPAPIYLTGPYEGAPFGLSIVVPIIAGPFNLGTEIVRARINIDPSTAQITVTTDPLPQIIKGVPADLRSIDAVIDRAGFMFNPTNCSPMSFSGTATSTQGTSAAISSPFQVGSCQALKFKPDLKITTRAKTSRLNGASLDVKLLYPSGQLGENQATSQANIAKVKVELPKRLPSRLTTLQKACRAATFEANPAACPAASIVGHATAITPELPVPVSGPAYFVSHGGEAFPSLVLVLQGYGVTVDFVGTTFISKAGVTSSTFKTVPDVPVTSFDLNLPEGPFSALAATGSLCKGSLSVPTELEGQNGATLIQSTKITTTGCPKVKKAKGKSSKKRR